MADERHDPAKDERSAMRKPKRPRGTLARPPAHLIGKPKAEFTDQDRRDFKKWTRTLYEAIVGPDEDEPSTPAKRPRSND